MIPLADLARQHRNHAEEIEAAVLETLRSGWYVLGSRVQRFEESFATFCGVEHAVGVASGTEAIQLALRAVGVQPGDEVATAANTCVPTVAAIVACGAVPKLVDVDPETLTLDPQRLEKALSPRMRAVVPVHLYGQCADMDPIAEIAREHGLAVVEDCAQAHGALYHGRHAGTLGDAGAFSFYPSKNLGAAGDAGLVTTRSESIAESVRRLRNYGLKTRYLSAQRGINSRLDELQAAILEAKLPHLADWVKRRRFIAARYSQALRGSTWLQAPVEADGNHHAFHLYVIRADGRDAFRAALRDDGIETEVHYPIPIHRQPAFAELAVPPDGLPVSEAASERVVSVPVFPELSDDEVAQVAASLARLAPAPPD